MTEAVSISMDWFLYKNGLRHEKVNWGIERASNQQYKNSVFSRKFDTGLNCEN